MRRILLCLMQVVLYFLLIDCMPTTAASFRSDSYLIDMGNFNVTSGKKTSDTYTLTDTVGQIAPGQYTSTGFVLKAGFQYIHDLVPFSFTISNLSVAFGNLTPNTLATQSHTITVSTGGAGGYQVLAHETHPLRYIANTIPDTTCDDTTCSESVCRPWTQTSTNGFGFSMTGHDVDTSATKFANATYFCQFANRETGETDQVVMSRTSPGKNRIATVTYQVNPPTLQETGDYETSIVFTAVPSY